MKKLLFFILVLFNFNASRATQIYHNLLIKSNIDSKDKLLIFYQPNCPYCVRMEQVLSEDKTFQAFVRQNFEVQTIDITTPSGKSLASQYHVYSVPTIIKSQENNLNYSVKNGFGSVAQLMDFLNGQVNPTSQPVLTDCGNGQIDSGETCDDGNAFGSDGCDATCHTEQGWSCSGIPSICQLIIAVQPTVNQEFISFFVCPNPMTNARLVLDLELKQAGAVEIWVTDLTGKTMLRETYEALAGHNNWTEVANWPKGQYFLQITQHTNKSIFRKTQKILQE